MITPIETVVYTGKTRTIGGRHGQSRSSDDRLVIDLSPLGSKGPGTNPEQLFGAGWSACFLSAIGKAAQTSQVSLPADAAVDAEIDLGRSGEAFFLAARLKVSLPGVDRAVGQSLIETAHQICPYSKASRGNIDVEITLA
ncbi:organic hydroperoxide resistance protein [Pseudoxanthomonas wuyuanensis]